MIGAIRTLRGEFSISREPGRECYWNIKKDSDCTRDPLPTSTTHTNNPLSTPQNGTFTTPASRNSPVFKIHYDILFCPHATSFCKSSLHTTMKVFSNNCTFDYSWEEVSTANWLKYCPWNDKSTHVIGVDTLSRHVDEKTGIVRIFPFTQ